VNLVITKSKREDINCLESRLREVDLLETASFGVSPKDALIDGLDGMAFTAKDKKDKVVCMFGSADTDIKGTGVVWMLGSVLVEKYKKDVLKLTKQCVEKICKPYSSVYNYIHESNAKSMRWLRWCGFDVDNARTYQFGGENFFYFHKDLSDV